MLSTGCKQVCARHLGARHEGIVSLWLLDFGLKTKFRREEEVVVPDCMIPIQRTNIQLNKGVQLPPFCPVPLPLSCPLQKKEPLSLPALHHRTEAAKQIRVARELFPDFKIHLNTASPLSHTFEALRNQQQFIQVEVDAKMKKGPRDSFDSFV